MSLPIKFLEEVKEYIESTEVRIDGEWGGGRSLPELIRDGYMPDLYNQVVAMLKVAKFHDTPTNP